MDWQTITAGVIVLIAAGWIIRRVLRIVGSGSRDGEGHVSSCGMCDKNSDAAKTAPLVQIKTRK